ncbi:hypothetical protein [Kitasatospora sp. NPDC002965]|uniref:hypothetical protein n=1 Tax=unclassified Kitasatospora TaxID=2633591 RepID=UPI0033A31930
MRIRRAAIIAATGLLPFALAFPTPASAATGDFLYKVGRGAPAGLVDPESEKCIDLPGATDEDPAFAPENFTTSTAVVFLESGCRGDVYRVMKPGAKLGNRLHLRSVLFS